MNEPVMALRSLIPLPRAVVHVTGDDADRFLQGLMSNDITLLQAQPSLYACFLNPQGRFLFESIIINDLSGGFYLDTEGGARVHDFIAHLNRHKLRARVTVSHLENAVVAAGVTRPAPGIIPYPDPRHENMPPRVLFLNPPDTEMTGSFDDWDAVRLKLGIPDGSRDTDIGISTLEELNITHLNGVSFTKGCYVGQELTARMENRGLAKKHLYPVHLTRSDLTPERGQLIYQNNVIIGEIRSSRQDNALALIRDTAVQNTRTQIILHTHATGWKID